MPEVKGYIHVQETKQRLQSGYLSIYSITTTTH